MTFLKMPLVAICAAMMGTTAMAVPAYADITIRMNTIRVNTGHTFFQVGHPNRYHQHGVPVVRYVYPDGRVVERYGYPHGRREVLVLPSPVVPHPPVALPQPSSRQSPVGLHQAGEPRLLHGQRIDPIHALIVGAGNLAGREGPGTVYPELTAFLSGQTVVVTQVAGGGDGYDWFLAASGQGQHAWIRGDRLSFYESVR